MHLQLEAAAWGKAKARPSVAASVWLYSHMCCGDSGDMLHPHLYWLHGFPSSA